MILITAVQIKFQRKLINRIGVARRCRKMKAIKEGGGRFSVQGMQKLHRAEE